ncbi:MAG TPA: sialidase family protein [Opitutaceae bacterium]|nr:sialidase family protein [Opitutaceae bacterium]
MPSSVADMPVRLYRAVLIAIAMTIGPAHAASAATPVSPPIKFQRYVWRDVVIGGGGFVTGLVFHPVEPNLLYARTDVGGTFRWDSSGRRWIPLNDNLSRDHAELLGVVSLAVDACDPERLYLACGSYLPDWGKPAALLWSPDRGVTWEHVPLPFKLGGNSDGRSTGERLQVDPHDGNILFLGSNQNGLWRSADRGRSWSQVTGFPARGVTLVLFDPRGAKGKATPTLYACASDLKGPAVFRSVDAGATWLPVPGQPAGFMAHHAAFDSNGTLYFSFANHPGPNGATNGAVWKLDPETGRWTEITPAIPNPAERDTFGYAGLATDAKQPGVVMVSTLDRWTRGDEIFRSTDAGASWKPVRPTSTWDASSAPYAAQLKPHWIGAFAIDPFNSDFALFVTGYGVWATQRATAVDTGAATPWTFANGGLEETVADGLVSPPVGAPLVSAIGDIGGFRHDDLSLSPASGTHQPFHGSSSSIDFARNLPAKLVRTHSGPTRGAISFDGGATWRDFASAPPAAIANGAGKIAIAADGRRIVWVPKSSAPFFSDDDGATWNESRGGPISPRDFHSTSPVADPVNATRFYLYDSVGGRVFISKNSGETFSAGAEIPPGGGTLRAEPDREGRLWVPTPQGLFVSEDSGAHFKRLASVDAGYELGFGRSAENGAPSTAFLLGRVGNIPALFRSDDAGKTWTAISDAAHKFGYLKAITGDPRVPGRVYLGTGGRGIVYGEPDPQ